VRRIAAAVCVAVALAACDGGQSDGVTPTAMPSPTPSTSPSPSPSPTPSPSAEPPPSASPTPEPSLQLPRDAPTELTDPLEPEELRAAGFAPLLPPGATATAVEAGGEPADRIAVAWSRGDDPFQRQGGLVVWQRFASGTPWRAVYAFTDRPSRGVLGIALDAGDLTGDGVDDLLSREELGGSGACATWRVIAADGSGAAEIYRHDACDTSIEIADGTLAMREAVYQPDDAHCCPSAFRHVTLEWDGGAFVRTSTEVVENPA
jgi:hypothetical protein